jgi:hypothetical protein
MEKLWCEVLYLNGLSITRIDIKIVYHQMVINNFKKVFKSIFI